MTEYVHLLSEAEIAALRALLGQPVHLLYTEAVEVYDRFVVAPDFSLPLGRNQFCVIESEWNDTAEESIDYHVIHVSLRDRPGGATWGRVEDRRESLGHLSTVHLLTPASEIISVQVLEDRESSGSESVHYDYALIFTREDGYRFSLTAHHPIGGGLEFTDREQEVESCLREYSERLRLGSS